MRPNREWLKGWPLAAGIAIVLVAVLPLLAAAVFMLRFALFAAVALAVLTGIVLLCVSPKFRAWLDLQSDGLMSFSGLRLARDVSVAPGHSWARIGDRRVTIGADDFIPRTLGPIEKVELPEPGTKIRQGDRLCRLTHGERTVELLSPVSGTVVRRNESLVDRPELVNDSPYGAGWAVSLQADDIETERTQLRSNNAARTWFRHEVDTLIGTILTPSAGNMALMPATSLPDGGVMVSDLHQQIDDQAWQKIDDTFFHPIEWRA